MTDSCVENQSVTPILVFVVSVLEAGIPYKSPNYFVSHKSLRVQIHAGYVKETLNDKFL